MIQGLKEDSNISERLWHAFATMGTFGGTPPAHRYLHSLVASGCWRESGKERTGGGRGTGGEGGGLMLSTCDGQVADKNGIMH